MGGHAPDAGRARTAANYQERVKQAVDFYQGGFVRRLVFSSGFVFALREAEVMVMLAVSLGVSELH